MTCHQVINVMHKNWILKRRNKCSTCCELLVPLVIVALLIVGYNVSSVNKNLANNYLDVEVWPDTALISTNRNITSSSQLFDILSNASSKLASSPSMQALLANSSNIQAANVLLCKTYGVCFSSALLDLGDVDFLQNTDSLQSLFNYPMPVLSFDLFVLIQKYMENRASSYIKRVAQLVPWLNSITKRRKLAFAPDTPEVRAMVATFNATYFFFGDIFYRIFPSEDAAISWARTDGQNKVWAVIVVRQLDALQGQFSYSIRMNQTAVPNTNTKVLKFQRGRSDEYRNYILSGFPSLQHLLDGYFLELMAGQPLGTSCPATIPAVVMDGTGEVATTGNLSWAGLADSFLSVLIGRLPRNITDLVPGLVDPVTRTLRPSALPRLRRIFTSPATTVNLVMPVNDYDGNDFFTFAADFIGMVGVFAYLFPVAVTVRLITQEKETRIKQSMLIMGLGPGCLYWSWLLTNLITAMFTAVFITIEMKFGFLKYTGFFVILILNLLLAFSIVAFAFLCSTFFNKARNAAIVAPLVLFAATIPALALPEGTSLGTKLILSLLSPAAYSWGMEIIAVYENLQVSMAWRDMSQKADDGYTVLYSVAMLVFDTFLYLFLGWYLDQTLPSSFGVRRSPCFCIPNCVRRLFRRKRHPEIAGPDAASDLELFESPPAELAPYAVVQMQNLRKEFKSVWRGITVAVDGLNMTMYENQINVVLGHNGAGKTTAINMMTGILAPTTGDCLIYGRSIRTEMTAVRGSLGLCPQHDTLWARLSVAEHLRFYARLKGLKGPDLEEAVRTTMQDVGLTSKAAAWSCTLSGGMKRRLSVGIALIGGSKVVFLDEPTSGMDPLARRHTWDLLRRAKQGRVLVLTTHFMDEADLLGDSIAIMSKGTTRCHGSPLFLKSRLGVGYNLSFDLKEGADRPAIRNTVLSHAPSASALSEVVGECQFKLPMSESPSFPEMFRALEDNSFQWGIISFGLSLSTIEEVFLRIAKESAMDDDSLPERQPRFRLPHCHWPWRRVRGPQEAKSAESILRTPSSPSRDDSLQPTSSSLPLDKSLQDANVRAASDDDTSVGPDRSLDPLEASPTDATTCSQVAMDVGEGAGQTAFNHQALPGLLVKGQLERGKRSFFKQVRISLQKRMEYARRDHRTMCLQILVPVVVIILALIVLSIPNPNRPALALNMGMFGKTDAPEMLAKTCGWSEDSAYWTPTPVYDIRAVNNSAQLSNYSLATFYNHVNRGTRAGGALYKDTVLLLKLLGNGSAMGGAVATPEVLLPVQATTIMHNASAIHAMPSTFSELNRARLKKRTRSATADIRAVNHPLPLTDQQQKRYDAIITVVAALFVLIPFTLFPANCVAFIVKEREVRAKHLQMLSGLRSPPYWVSCYIFDNCAMLVTTILTVAIFGLFRRTELVGTVDRVVGVFVLFILYGLSSIALGYVCSFAFTNHSVAQTILMIVNFFFGFALVLGSQIMNSLPDVAPINRWLEWVFRLVPAFCLGEGIMRLSAKPIYEINWGRTIPAFEWGFLGRDCLYMSLTAPIYFLMVLYIDSDRRSRVSHATSRRCGPLLLRLRSCLRWCCCWCCRRNTELLEEDMTAKLEEDEDVAQEREAVEAGDGRQGDKVTIQRLRKTYPGQGKNPPKTAVHDLSLGVPNNEIFALLGSNGAGKTTTLSMLSGEFPPTSGRILLNGFDIQKERQQAQSNIGYCPQFDALLDHLSVDGHLRLYGRLRGIPPADLPRVIDDIVQYLGLEPHRKKSAMSLSGGNKRKLSIGIAIMGCPDVVFLDEPSSGLDPVSRRSLWTCISDLALNRSIILTTHHLEEVDALAHRVTIMLHGRMRCLGTLQRIKSKFGDGYRLQFRLPPARQPELTHHLIGHWPALTVEEESFGRVVYQLPRTNGEAAVRMSEIFGVIQKAAPTLEIQDYSASQTTLQDVFLKLTVEDEALRNPLTRDLARDELLLPRVPSFGEMSIVSLGEWDATCSPLHTTPVHSAPFPAHQPLGAKEYKGEE